MKTVLLFLVLIFVSSSFAQTVQISQKTQFDVAQILRHNVEIRKGNADLLNLYPIMKLDNEHYVSFLGKKNFGAVLVSNDEIIFGATTNSIVSVRVRLDKLDHIHSIPGLSNLELAGKIKPDLDKVTFDTRVDSVHAGYGLPEAYTGKDVFIGITDWGFDFTSPMFYDTLLQETRVFAAWDQFKTGGPSPAGYNYGTEYTTITEFIAAGADTANIYSYATHGTHVAGIAGGSGAGLQYRGVAFESQFLFTTFLVDEAAVLDAWNWMYDIAQNEGKRLVMNMSWGLYHFGTNDGNSLLSQAISDFSDDGVVFATSGGNNGNVNFHIQKDFNNDALKTRIEFYSYAANPYMWGQSIHFWGEQGSNFEAKLEVLNGSNSSLVDGFFVPSSLNGYLDTFMVTGLDTIWYNIAAESVHPLNGRPTMRLRVKNTNTSLKVILHVQATTGKVHLWNVTELTTDVGNWGMSFTSPGTGYTIGNPFYGIGEPAAANDVIAVAAHAASYLNTGGNLVGGNRATFSSIGPRYDGVMKPDICAPGQSVASSISSYTDNSFTSIGSVSFQGRTYPFARFSGTSMSSPAVAGICALILDANPFLSAQQVKEIIETTARLDNFTGAIPSEGDSIWGHGKVNAYAAVQMALEIVGIETLEDAKEWKLFPNPSAGMVVIDGVEEVLNLQIIDLQGKQASLPYTSNGIDVSMFPSGIYIVRFVSQGKVYQKKLVISAVGK